METAWSSITYFVMVYWPILLIIWGTMMAVLGFFFLGKNGDDDEEN